MLHVLYSDLPITRSDGQLLIPIVKIEVGYHLKNGVCTSLIRTTVCEMVLSETNKIPAYVKAISHTIPNLILNATSSATWIQLYTKSITNSSSGRSVNTDYLRVMPSS